MPTTSPLPSSLIDSNRRRLLAALRDIPEDFTWDFTQSFSRTERGSVGCAIGLAYELNLSNEDNHRAVARSLGISRADVWHIFIPGGDDHADPPFVVGYPDASLYSDVTPSMVAQKLEELLVTKYGFTS